MNIQLLSDVGAPAGAVGVISNGSLSRVEVFGDASPSTEFLFGSVSKPIAAKVALTSSDQGVLDLDAPLGQGITTQDLLNHTAGIRFGVDILDRDRPEASAIEVAQQYPMESSGVGQYSYSSLGYLYVQAMIEKGMGEPYEDALREVFPLQQFGASAESCGAVVQGHRLAGPIPLPITTAYDGAGGAYGYTCGSIEDLATFAVNHLSEPTLGAGTSTGTAEQRYADGWRVTAEQDGTTTHWHTGTVPGYSSAIFLNVDSGDGVVILSNASGFLHEEEFYGASRALYDESRGSPVTPPDTVIAADAIPSGLVALAVLVVLLQSWGSRKTGVE